MKQAILVCAMLLVAAGPVLARDIVPLPWDPAYPTVTSQAWEFTHDPPGPWSYANNPYGPPSMVADGDWTWPFQANGPDGAQITVLHFGPGGGSISVTIPNNPNPNLQKLIQYQVTSDKGMNGVPTTTPPGTIVPGSLGNAGWPNSNWYTYSGVIGIPGNPSVETIIFNFYPDTNVEEIVIKTVCIPEPATVGLLAAGLSALALRRRKRRR